MKTCSHILALALFSASLASAKAQPGRVIPDKNVLKVMHASQEQRADLLLDEIKKIDGRIEDRVDHLLATLRMVGDSKDSRTKVARMKEDTIAGLQKSIAYYQQKRSWLQEELRRPTYTLTEEEKKRIISRFDERIEKRVKQILELNKSMPTHQDYEQYKAVSGGWYGETTFVESEDYKQNRRLASHTNALRDKLIKELQKSIDRLESQNRDLARQQAAAKNSELRLALGAEPGKNEELLNVRRTQLQEMFTVPSTPTRPVSGKEAQALDVTMKQSIDSLRRDFTTLFQRYSVWLGERSSANIIKAELAKAK